MKETGRHRFIVDKEISYQEFIDKVHEVHSKMNGAWRLGQTYFNVLSNCKSDLAEAIRSTIHDPFYKNEISKELEQLIKSKW